MLLTTQSLCDSKIGPTKRASRREGLFVLICLSLIKPSSLRDTGVRDASNDSRSSKQGMEGQHGDLIMLWSSDEYDVAATRSESPLGIVR